MHRPMEEGLESYLAGRPEAQFVEHVAQCAECREMVMRMEEQAKLLRVLKGPAEIEPAPGFYGRVMDRIETQREFSIWGVFLEPLFARRLIYASAALTVLLGVFLFTSPKDDDDRFGPSTPEMILAEDAPPPQPNVVLVQLTTYEE